MRYGLTSALVFLEHEGRQPTSGPWSTSLKYRQQLRFWTHALGPPDCPAMN
jgi:hypothetical protein